MLERSNFSWLRYISKQARKHGLAHTATQLDEFIQKVNEVIESEACLEDQNCTEIDAQGWEGLWTLSESCIANMNLIPNMLSRKISRLAELYRDLSAFNEEECLQPLYPEVIITPYEGLIPGQTISILTQNWTPQIVKKYYIFLMPNFGDEWIAPDLGTLQHLFLFKQ